MEFKQDHRYCSVICMLCGKVEAHFDPPLTESELDQWSLLGLSHECVRPPDGTETSYGENGSYTHHYPDGSYQECKEKI